MKEVDDYVREGWNKKRIAEHLTPAGEWAQRNHARLLVLEYGVLKEGWARHDTDPDTRYRWIGDVTSVLDSLHIGHTIWDESDNFGIDDMIGETSTDPHDGSRRFIHPETGERRIQPGAAEALGLSVKP